MKYLLFLALVVVTNAADCSKLRPDVDWPSFKKLHGKRYQDSSEENARRTIWRKNCDVISTHNQEASQGLHSFFMKDNELTDRLESRGDATTARGSTYVPKNIQEEPVSDLGGPEARQALPASVDLRSSRCMPAVKNQRQCGSCWAFAATTPVEYLTCNSTNTLILLSESQLVNCSFAQGNQGCSGGWYDSAWNYIRVAPGQARSSVLPYYPAWNYIRVAPGQARSSVLPYYPAVCSLCIVVVAVVVCLTCCVLRILVLYW